VGVAASVGRGRIFLGRETFRCPRCRRPVPVEVHSDVPDQDWLGCPVCGYRALLNFRPLLDKYGVPCNASITEKREAGDFLQRETAKI
jgi:DNA-directed RNA polymerase subunit RPC12/RpoP